MEIFLSKRTIIKAILLGLLMTFAALLIAAKVIFDLASESVLSEFSVRDIFSYFLGLVGIAGFLVFGTMTFIFISRLFQTAPQVIITFEGIEDKRLNCGLIN